MASLVIVGGVSGGIGSTWVRAKTEPNPSPTVAKEEDPYFTVGCIEKNPKDCAPDTFIKVVAFNVDRYKLEPVANKPAFWLKKCPGEPQWPFDVGDTVISFTYQENYEHQCQKLGPHWGWYGLRDENGLTDSEQASKGGTL